VLNLGLPGGGTEHQYRIYRRYAAPLRPELVIAVLWPTWDIENSLHFEHWLTEESDLDYTEYRTTYNVTHRNSAQAEPTGLERVWDFVKSQLAESYLVRAGYRSLKSLLGTDRMVSQVTFPDGNTILLSAQQQMRLARGIDRPDAPDIREIFLRPLERLRTEVEAQGGHFVVLLLPGKEEIYGGDTFPAVLRTVQEVKSELDSRQFQILDLYPPFRQRGQESPPFYRADMHLNELGNQIVADAIEQWIADENIFTGRSPATDLAGDGAD
jgi:hypothetical protein